MKADMWLICPACGGKTRCRVRADTVMINYPLFCPKCRRETLINVKDFKITSIKEPDAQTQSQ
ncbi:MAG: cysteine-rich KTR domain-containing protein [Acutalibacteraceae bacterium]